MKSKIYPQLLIYLLINVFSSSALANDPGLHFSDLVSGPDTGLGDGNGSGVIVTAWGSNLGSSQGNSTIEYCDSTATCRLGHVFYWKNADGMLPGGPANLFASHGMQEIAFSVPDGASGPGSIKVTVNSVVSTLPFTVRGGNIYHVKSTGSDSNNGSWSNPWRTVDHALDTVDAAGSTIYVHSVASGSTSSARGIQWNNATASSSLSAQFGLIAYPNNQPSSTGYLGIVNNNVDGLVVSKFTVFASNRSSVDANGQPSNQQNNSTKCMETDKFGRLIGNRCTDIPGWCADGAQGAIQGNALNGNDIEGVKVYGNEVHDYGCEGTSKFHHTTYFSIRSGSGLVVEPWDIGWNYLHDNHAKNGIHNYDEGVGCGTINGDIHIHDNVVVNQGGAGISIGSKSDCPWSNDWKVYNNILINTGLAAGWDGINVQSADAIATEAILIRDGQLTGQIEIYNNTIYKWNDDNLSGASESGIGFVNCNTVTVIAENNIFYTEKDKSFVGTNNAAQGCDTNNIMGSTNIWRTTVANPTKAIAPSWDAGKIESDPLLTFSGPKVILDKNSPAVDAGIPKPLLKDVYGTLRINNDIGVAEFAIRPNSPSGIGAN